MDKLHRRTASVRSVCAYHTGNPVLQRNRASAPSLSRAASIVQRKQAVQSRSGVQLGRLTHHSQAPLHGRIHGGPKTKAQKADEI